jgi:hypothetical protein
VLNKNDRIVCDDCGKFISIEDLIADIAIHRFVLPDSEFSKETYESICAKCLEEQRGLLLRI